MKNIGANFKRTIEKIKSPRPPRTNDTEEKKTRKSEAKKANKEVKTALKSEKPASAEAIDYALSFFRHPPTTYHLTKIYGARSKNPMYATTMADGAFRRQQLRDQFDIAKAVLAARESAPEAKYDISPSTALEDFDWPTTVGALDIKFNSLSNTLRDRNPGSLPYFQKAYTIAREYILARDESSSEEEIPPVTDENFAAPRASITATSNSAAELQTLGLHNELFFSKSFIDQVKDIKSALKVLSLLLHPDKNLGVEKLDFEEGVHAIFNDMAPGEAMKILNKAREALAAYCNT
jgi:hypothetical protein